jgi:hypothetical protein
LPQSLSAGLPAVDRKLLDALDALAAEQSVRRALQQRCETQQEILGKAAYQACREVSRGC